MKSKTVGIFIFIASILILFFITVSAHGEIMLNSPKQIKAPAVKVKVYSYTVTPDTITANLNWYDSTGNIVLQSICTVTDNNYTSLTGKTIKSSQNGKKLFKVIKKKIQSKCKNILLIQGVEQ